MSVSRTWLVTGASRGIGFNIVQQLLRSPHNVVFAACRNPASALYVVQMDVTDEASISRAKDEVENILGHRGCRILNQQRGYTTLAPKDLSATIIANVAGPALVTRAFIPLIEKGSRKVIANISTALASIGIDYGGQHASYSISKAALNMLTYKQAKERWVKTDMGGTNATLEPHESAAGIIQVVSSATAAHAGRFIDYKGRNGALCIEILV
ncbi:hypothetical protein BU15DRAFT_87806 [Melanogaster broomeanus]|nr:hypothetical protein BU15DRAFT_87806 [Melanogaster broomeanus]